MSTKCITKFLPQFPELSNRTLFGTGFVQIPEYLKSRAHIRMMPEVPLSVWTTWDMTFALWPWPAWETILKQRPSTYKAQTTQVNVLQIFTQIFLLVSEWHHGPERPNISQHWCKILAWPGIKAPLLFRWQTMSEVTMLLTSDHLYYFSITPNEKVSMQW